MARPLTTEEDDCSLVRPNGVEDQIDAVLGLAPAVLRERLVIVDRGNPDYLFSETLVHLVRHGRRAEDQNLVSLVLPVLLGRCEANLLLKVPDGQMTVHGSKGLEFEAVHVPALTKSSFPASNRGQRCPPPIGMIEGDGGVSVADAAKLAHEQEEECLFFVALSRARTHLSLYLARKQPNGNNRSPSPYLEWLPQTFVGEVARPVTMARPPGWREPAPIAITWPADWSLTDSRLGAYEKCPRRFFYTHALGLGGARKATAFSRTHDCLYDLLRWLTDARRTATPSAVEAEAAFETIWKKRGPINHAFAADYHRLATRMIRALINAGAGRRFRDAEPLAVEFANGRLLVEPNELSELADGTVVIRRVRTGHRRSDEYDRLEYTLYQLAAQAKFGARAVVQALHLTDEIAEVVTISATKLGNRRTNSETMLARIAGGAFPAEIDPVTCPRCPHFFLCPAMPDGPLNLT